MDDESNGGPLGSDDSPSGSLSNPFSDNPNIRPASGDPYGKLAANAAKTAAHHKAGKGGHSTSGKSSGGGKGGKR